MGRDKLLLQWKQNQDQLLFLHASLTGVGGGEELWDLSLFWSFDSGVGMQGKLVGTHMWRERSHICLLQKKCQG